MTIAKQDLSEVLTETEYNSLTQKLDDAIESKVTWDDPNSSINLSLFGLQDSDSLRRFLLTPAGETVTHEIGAELMLERAIEEERQLQLQEEIRMEERRRAIFEWLMEEDDAEAQKAQNEIIEMQNEKKRKDEQKAQQKTDAPESKKETEDTIKRYDEAIKQLEKDQAALEQRSKKLKEERTLITNKYDAMENSLEDAPDFLEKTEEEIDAEIKKLQGEADKIADSMMEPGISDEEVFKRGDQLNAITSKISNLNDIRDSKKTDGKKFVDAEGKTTTYQEAAFVIPKKQEIVKDKDGNYYLLKNGQTEKDLQDPKIRNEAREAFKSEKKNIQLVKDVVKETKKDALTHNETRIAENKAETAMLQNQMRLMQSARAQAQQTLTNQATLEHASPQMTCPQSSKTPGNMGLVLPMPTQSNVTSTPGQKPSQLQIQAAAQFVQTVNQNQQTANKSGKGYQWNKFLDDVDKIDDPAVKEHAKKFSPDGGKTSLKDKLNLKETLNKTPVPDEIMNGFLRHMAKFEDAYKPSVTAEPSPLAQREQTQPDIPSAPDRAPSM
ncbi:coiled coil protein [Fluoribacter dumoffii]|uniref:LidA long coiled-coil domain-containing protein n=1 Tax=Fluoribacter dumoffii TaxID=463 RepID=A0A377GAH7_9GAMM|nr:coiled-coil protein [Fluoribacter dumoffii]KTC88690.1 coiled coil protein [Fluoribacter dumoffii NY 23]MCW8386017.1 coiled coil protein [Fluoribacter dumoffii]MCW8419069.1 coiled coil protein [Fluoribacter dumoffii]MCW8453087.1 coiled coil protein [Fluoribacter dumoffii]MCW8459695.1 coiled coil protein [Fluoribacter dumoffii]